MKQHPSRLKFKKNHKVNFKFFSLIEKKNFYPLHGHYALKSLQPGKLTLQQIEAGRKSIRRSVKKAGKLFIRVFTSKSITKKPLATRMGKGKGNHSLWLCPIKKGQVIYELAGLSNLVSSKALQGASAKLPFKTKVIKLFF
jgi:large subunit ribosomal protein L16